MSFEIILKDLVNRTGGRGAIMFDYDGEIVASHAEEKLDMELIGAHHGVVLNIIKEASSRNDELKGIKEVVITTDRTKLVLHTLKDGYCLLLLLKKTGYVGNAMHESIKTVSELEAEMG